MEKFAIPMGTRDLIAKECKSKRALQKAIEEVFESYGYEEIITPTIEYYKTYQVGFDDVQEEEMYKFFDQNGRILALRADMTIPIARVAATKFKDQKPPLRFSYCANVYKVKKSFAGKRNEVSDCGIELMGLNAKESDLEVLLCALQVMDVVKKDEYTLELGDVNFFRNATAILGLKEDEISNIADLIDRKSLIELEQYLNKLALNQNAKDFFMQLPWLCGGVEILKEAYKYCFDENLSQIINRLQQLYDDLSALGYNKQITFDLGKLPHLNYYSGLIFEGFISGVGTSVLSGGRYDNLLSKFGKDMPAIGFSVKLDYALENKYQNETKQKIVLAYPDDKRIEALKYSLELRKQYIVSLLRDNSLDQYEVRGISR